MSIALDAALYLREQELPKEKKLTITERGAFFTLLFRQGSNAFAWVSQETLAIELDINISNVRRLMKSLEKKGWILIQKNTKDRRKLDYRSAEFLLNYTQSSRKQTKEYRSKSSGNSKNTAQNQAVYTAQNQAVISNKKNATAPATHGLHEFENSPKEKVVIKEKQKRKRGIERKKRVPLSDDFKPDALRCEGLEKQSSKTGIDKENILSKFKVWAKGKVSDDWQNTFELFVLREYPVREAKNKTNFSQQEISSPVNRMKEYVSEKNIMRNIN